MSDLKVHCEAVSGPATLSLTVVAEQSKRKKGAKYGTVNV